MTIFSGQSVISRVYTSRFGNGTSSHGTSTEVVLKKYQVPGTVPSGKPPKSEPYRTVPCRTMQWKSAISHRSSQHGFSRGLEKTANEYSSSQSTSESRARGFLIWKALALISLLSGEIFTPLHWISIDQSQTRSDRSTIISRSWTF